MSGGVHPQCIADLKRETIPTGISERISEWNRDLDRKANYVEIQERIEYLAEKLFDEFEPTQAAGQARFDDRLGAWLDSAADIEDQKTLFRLVAELLFVGRREFESLYQAALNGPIARWLIDSTDLQLNDADLSAKLREGLRHTWFCPITDSMPIASFYHFNRLEGVDLRPDWRTLEHFADSQKVVEYMRTEKPYKPRFDRLVLLEDFVGSGDQMHRAATFAANLPGHIPVLICPMLICPHGAVRGRDLEHQFSTQVRFEPIVEISADWILSREAVPGESQFLSNLREVVERLHPRVMGSDYRTAVDSGAFGWKGTGSLVVLYSNCPNNTPPIVHHDSDGPWKALFPRSERVSP
jgi:hypothetical protein